MQKLLISLALLLAFSPLVHAQNEPTPPIDRGAPLAGHPDARNDRYPESKLIGTHSVMRCKDGTMHKAGKDACRGHTRKTK